MGDTRAAQEAITQLRQRRSRDLRSAEPLYAEFRTIAAKYRVPDVEEVSSEAVRELTRVKRHTRDDEIRESGLFQSPYGNAIPVIAALHVAERRLKKDPSASVPVENGARMSVVTLGDRLIEVRALRDENLGNVQAPRKELLERLAVVSHDGQDGRTRREYVLQHPAFFATVSRSAPGALCARVTLLGEEWIALEVLREFLLFEF